VTECRVVPTFCTTEDTTCPVVLTTCPQVRSICPTELTRCPGRWFGCWLQPDDGEPRDLAVAASAEAKTVAASGISLDKIPNIQTRVPPVGS